MSGVRVVEVSAEATHDLRRAVLRGGRDDAVVEFDVDREPGAFHLAAVDGDGRPVAVASFAPRGTGHRPGARAVQLRGMAVAPEQQGTGVGRAIMAAAIERLRGDGYDVLWANARDTALGFYARCGMQVVGDGFVTGETGIPHHTVVLDLVTRS